MVSAADRPMTGADGSALYYRGTAWNDLEPVRLHLNRLVSGDPERAWWQHFDEWSGQRLWGRALMLNCGSGWVERDLARAAMISHGIGVDASPELLAHARAAAEAEGLPLSYRRIDVDRDELPGHGVDLCVNHAAAHHLRYVDRVIRSICALLPADGVFVSYDYVGPHRNQWDWPEWEAMHELNESLPTGLRQDLRYPHVPYVLAGDPSEAVHSELILETIDRYFEVIERTDLGGALAYPLLTHNERIFSAPSQDREPVIASVLAADAAYLEERPETTLFTYIVARPRSAALDDTAQLARWTAEENDRERTADIHGGIYYPPTALQTMNGRLVAAEERLARRPTARLARLGRRALDRGRRRG